MNVDRELSAIAAEYESYFPECSLVLRTCLRNTPDSTTLSHLRITTKEGTKLQVSVTVGGWFVVGKEAYYQTFEALMNNESPLFCQTFANSLTSKLNALAQSQ